MAPSVNGHTLKNVLFRVCAVLWLQSVADQHPFRNSGVTKPSKNAEPSIVRRVRLCGLRDNPVTVESGFNGVDFVLPGSHSGDGIIQTQQ